MVRLFRVHAQVTADEHFAEEVAGAILRDEEDLVASGGSSSPFSFVSFSLLLHDCFDQ